MAASLRPGPEGLEALEGWGRRLTISVIGLGLALGAAHVALLTVSLDATSAPLALAGALVGVLAADALTGLVHWSCDTWGDERTPWLGPTLIRAFREHHESPGRMLEHPWTHVNREPCLAAAAAWGLLWLPAARHALAHRPFGHALLCAFIACGAAANQLHAWAHMQRPPALVRLAQRCGLLLSPERHARHHRPPRAQAYCVATGWMNPVLDRTGFWRGLERALSRLTGARSHVSVGATGTRLFGERTQPQPLSGRLAGR